MHVLVVGKDLDLCEAHIFAGLARKGVSFEVLIDPALYNSEILENAGVHPEAFDLRIRIDFKAVRELRRRIRQGGFDLIHCLTNRALSNVLLASAGMGIKRVAYRGTVGHLSRLDPFSWLAYLNPGVHKIICVSKAVSDYLNAFVPASRLITIYKGHDVSWYSPESGQKLSDFGIPDGAFTVTCVANMRPVKGVPCLIEAIRRIPAAENVHLLLIGRVEDSHVSRLMEDKDIAGRVHLTGFLKNVAGVVAQSDAFVMPSVNREGLPKALIEAMALGVPSIVSRVGGMPEVVLDGTCGFVVPPRDADAIAEAIRILKLNPEMAKSFGEAGRQRIIKSFNVETSIEETYRVYAELTS